MADQGERRNEIDSDQEGGHETGGGIQGGRRGRISKAVAYTRTSGTAR